MEALRVLGLGPVEFEIGPAECVAISGPSGSGKTLLLRALADLDAHEGRVWLDGVECRELPAPVWRQRVALLPAESAWWHDRVAPHFANGGPDPRDLAALGLPPEIAQAPVSHLSSGERQRLALLRLLAGRPRALLLDEPTAHLDAESRERAEALVAAYREREAIPILWVTHDPGQARSVATRRYRLAAGRLEPEPA